MKKLFISLLTFLTLLCAFGLTACGEPEHKHNFVEQIITEENLASRVSCEEKAKYYYTCSCGKIGTETFEDGEALGHAFTDYKSDNNATFTEDGTKTAVCDREGCSKTHTITDEGSKLESYISFKTLNVNDLNVYGKVSNATYEFDFTEEIEVIGIYEYVVSLDFYGANQVLTKKVPLSVGDNVVYVFEMNGKDIVNTYQITIRRRPIHTVEFYYKNTFIESQQVEEDSFALEPNQPTKAGYTFTGWDFDFNTAITGNRTVNATYTNNKSTEYRVEHYFENLEDDGYTLDSSITDTLTGETDTLATATPKDIAHFTYKATSMDSGNINGDGSTVLKVYYTRNRYNVVLNKLDNKGNVSGSGIYANAQEVVATATLNDGYNFLGWYDGEEQVSTSLTYSFNPTKDITLVAKWLAIFNVSNGKITGLTSHGETLSSLVIPESIDGVNITSIGSSAFEDCDLLESVSLGENITHIEDKAFANCISLKTIIIPKFVAKTITYKISETAFDNCISLQNINFLGTIDEWIQLVSRYQLYNPYFGYYLYINCELQTEITINEKEICSYAFYNCLSLKSVVISDNAKSIGDYAFYGCSSLENIVIPNSVTSIGSAAFAYCDSLTSVVIGNGVTSIGSFTFSSCDALISIVIPKSVTSIGSCAFFGSRQLKIYCEANSKPSGWDILWNYHWSPVVWGYTNEN